MTSMQQISEKERAALLAAARGTQPSGGVRAGVVPAAAISAAVTGTRPNPARPSQVDSPTVSPIEALLARSQMHDRVRVRVLGEKIVKLVAELRGLMQVNQAEQKAIERITAARKELDAAQAALKALRSKQGTATGSPAPLDEQRAARAWAAANNIDCPTAGRVSNRVMAQWREATS